MVSPVESSKPGGPGDNAHATQSKGSSESMCPSPSSLPRSSSELSEISLLVRVMVSEMLSAP